jgi:xanthine/uracil permease
MNRLPARQQKKSQLVRTGYLGVGVGVVLIIIAIATFSIILGILGIAIAVIAGWATSIFKGA